MGGGGSSGLGIRSIGFFGGRSGTQSSRAMVGPMIIGPKRSLDSVWRCWIILSRMEEYSEAEEVLRTVAKCAACVDAAALLIPGIPIDRVDRGGGGGGDPF